MTILSPSTPLTFRSGSTTPHCAYTLSSASVLVLTNSGVGPTMYPSHACTAMSRFTDLTAFFESEDVKASGVVCRVDGRCCEAVRRYQLDYAGRSEGETVGTHERSGK
jgi:hypothetical protein